MLNPLLSNFSNYKYFRLPEKLQKVDKIAKTQYFESEKLILYKSLNQNSSLQMSELDLRFKNMLQVSCKNSADCISQENTLKFSLSDQTDKEIDSASMKINPFIDRINMPQKLIKDNYFLKAKPPDYCLNLFLNTEKLLKNETWKFEEVKKFKR
jgi:hypothetical protein